MYPPKNGNVMSLPCRDACSARSTDFLQAFDEKIPSSHFSNREFTLLLKLHSLASNGWCQMFSNQTQKVAAHATSCVFTDYRYNLHVILNRRVGHKWNRKKVSAPGSDLSSRSVRRFVEGTETSDWKGALYHSLFKKLNCVSKRLLKKITFKNDVTKMTVYQYALFYFGT
jgi:hypothetical protein